METDFQLADLIGSVYQNGNICFPEPLVVASPVGNRIKLIDLKHDSSHLLQCQSNFNIVYVAFNASAKLAAFVNDVSIVSLVSLTHGVIVYQRRLGKDIRCLAFSPNEKYLAIGMDGIVAVYSVDITGESAVPLRLLMRRRFGNTTAATAITMLRWSGDSRMLIASSRTHSIRIFSPLQRNPKFPMSVISDSAEIIGAFFSNDDNYDFFVLNRRAKYTPFSATLKPKDWSKKEVEKIRYNKADSVILYDLFNGNGRPDISAVSYTSSTQSLAVGFEDSAVVLLNLEYQPTVIKHLNLNSSIRVEAIDISSSLLAFATGRGFSGSLFVWDIKSEIFVVKQQSHTKPVNCAAFSPLGLQLATGGEDGLVKLWSAQSSMCTVTLDGHTAPITSIHYLENGKAILSAAMDGKVVAHDLKRYRNFRTMVSPKQTQLEHLCSDKMGINCLASSPQFFEIYIWSLESGDMLEVLKGHNQPITGLSLHALKLVSVSVDKTVRCWDISTSEAEPIQLSREALTVKHSPDGYFFAVLCLDSTIHVFDSNTSNETFILETKMDMDVGFERGQRLAKQTIEKNKSYTCLEFNPTGTLLLAGGQSNIFSLYDFQTRSILRRFTLSENRSIEGTLARFNPTLFYGMKPTDSDEEGAEPIAMPGVKNRDLSHRTHKPISEVRSFAFNPIGRSFIAVSSEGVVLYSLDKYKRFQPKRLTEAATPANVYNCINSREFRDALIMSMALGDDRLIEAVLIQIHIENIAHVIRNLNDREAGDLLTWLATNIRRVGRCRATRYFTICRELLYQHGHIFKAQLSHVTSITSLQQYFQTKKGYFDLVLSNKGILDYVITMRELEEMQNGIDYLSMQDDDADVMEL